MVGKINSAEISTAISRSVDRWGRSVVLKSLDLEKANQFDLDQFEKEVTIRERLGHHPQILSLYDTQGVQMRAILVLEPANMDLFEYLVKHGPLNEVLARDCFLQICKGLKVLHRRQIAHHDLKLENILVKVGESGNSLQLLLGDFGLSQDYSETQEADPTTDLYSGTYFYLAPEILLSYKKWSPFRSDIWALGLILFLLLFGQFPFSDPKETLAYNWSIRQTIQKMEIQPSIWACDLIEKILVRPPLGRASLDEILQHPFLNKANH